MKFHTLNLILLAATASAVSIPRQEQAVLAAPPRSRLTPSATQHATEIIPSPSPPPEHLSGTTTITTTVTETETIAITTATVLRTETETATPSAVPKPTHRGWGWPWGDRTESHDDGIKKGSKSPEVHEGMGCFCSGGSICCYTSEPRLLCNYGTCGVI